MLVQQPCGDEHRCAIEDVHSAAKLLARSASQDFYIDHQINIASNKIARAVTQIGVTPVNSNQ